MVNVVKGENLNPPRDHDVYQCKECCLHYADLTVASKCEAWCGEHKSCNLELIAKAIESEKKG